MKTPPAHGAARSAMLPIDVAAAILLAGAGALAYLAVVAPANGRRIEGARREAALGAHAAELTTFVARGAETAVALERVGSLLELNKVALQPATRLNERLKTLTDAAYERGLKIDQVEPGPVETLARFKRVPIHIAGAGPYESFSGLLADLHASRDVEVVGFSLQGRPQTPGAPAVYAVDVFWYASIDGAVPAGNPARDATKP